MKSIWKFDLTELNQQAVKMPEGSKLLAVQMQYNSPKLWALVDMDNPPIERVIRFIGTGHKFEDSPGEYLGTIQFLNGSLIAHVFDGGEQS